MAKTLTKSAETVFGVLREADEIELWMWEVAKRCGYGIMRTRSGVSDLRKRGIVETRRCRASQGGICGTRVRLTERRES